MDNNVEIKETENELSEVAEIEESNRKDNSALRLGLLIAAFVILLAGVSFAVWRYTYTGNKSSISTGAISLELLESETNLISINNALPMSDTDGMAQTDVFDFAITTTSPRAGNMIYTIAINKLSVDSGMTALTDDQIKVYLTNGAGTQLVAPTLIDDLTNYQLYTKTDAHTSSTQKITTKYKLRAWIDGQVDASSWTSSTHNQYKFKITVSESGSI